MTKELDALRKNKSIYLHVAEIAAVTIIVELTC